MRWLTCFMIVIVTIAIISDMKDKTDSAELQITTDEVLSDFVIVDGEVKFIDHHRQAVAIDIEGGTAKPLCIITTGREIVITGLEPYPTYGDLFIYEDNTTWEATMFGDGAVMLGEGICAHKENPNVYYKDNGTWRKR